MTNSEQKRTYKKRLSPLSIRLNKDERDDLRRRAGNYPLSTYAKSLLFPDVEILPRKAPKRVTADRQELARVLAYLGLSRVGSNLQILAYEAQSGNLLLGDVTTKRVMIACDDVRIMRNLLLSALGKRVGDDEDDWLLERRPHFHENAIGGGS